MRRLLFPALLLLTAAPAAPAPEASPELVALVPQETLLLVEGNDLDGVRRYGAGTALGRLLAEPEVRRFLEGLGESTTAGARGPLALVGLAPEDFHGIRLRRWGVAVVDASFEERPVVDALLYLEARSGGEKARKIAQAVRSAAETFLPVRFAEADVRGRKVHVAAVGGHEVCVASEGDRLVVTTRRARMEEVLDALDRGHPQPLRAAPRLVRLRERMGAARCALFGYLDAPALGRKVGDAWERGSPRQAEGARRVARAVGLDAVEAVAFADVAEGGRFRTEAAALLKERRGVFALLPSGRPGHRFARLAPADALAYGGGTFDATVLREGVLALAGALGARERLEEAERRANEALRLDLRKDLFAALGTECAGYVAWPAGGGLLPDFAVSFAARDRERLARTLDAVAACAGDLARARGASVTPRRTEFRGTEIRFLEITDRRGDPRPYAPAWAFGEDFVVVGLWPQSVKHALAEKAALAGRVGFQELVAAAPRTTVSAAYVDFGRAVAWLYATAAPFLQIAQSAINRRLGRVGTRVNLEDLPPAEVLARHLGGALFYTAVEEDCVRAGAVSDLGAPVLLVPAAAVLGGLAVARMSRSGTDLAGEREASERRRGEPARGRAAAEAEARRDEELGRLQAENALLRERLARIEAEVAELRRLVEEGRR